MKQHTLDSICVLLIFLSSFFFCQRTSATDENLNNQRFLSPINENQLLNSNRRFQHIMQGGSNVDSVWPEPSSNKAKTEKKEIKSEIAKLNSSYVYQSDWPASNVKLGSVTAVSFDKDGNVVLFHRCDRVWEQRTFNNANVFTQRNKGPIADNTVLALERKFGTIVYQWGKQLFYMPHGLTVDHEDNVWITDVALHQVFKFGPRGSNDKPLMTLGTMFEPGSGDKFCKPTSVAVLENGDFFVADGYCNARILKYSKDGQRILVWGQNSFAGVSHETAPANFFAIPHALTLVPEQKLICTADRENGRIQCFFWINGTFHSQYHSPIIGDRLFSMDYTPAFGGEFVIVNGPTAEIGINPDASEVRGYVMNITSKQVVSKFGPNDLQFENPHDIAVTKDGLEIFVAELDPTRIHKFLHKTVAKTMSLSAAKPTATTGVGPEYEITSLVSDSKEGNAAANVSDNTYKSHMPGGTAILVASLMLLFAFLTFAMALLIARRRRRGCLPLGASNRRHAWDFPSRPDGFTLGGLLMDRGKRSGFEQLDQNASDEEHESSTNRLASAQFA